MLLGHCSVFKSALCTWLSYLQMCYVALTLGVTNSNVVKSVLMSLTLPQRTIDQVIQLSIKPLCDIGSDLRTSFELQARNLEPFCLQECHLYSVRPVRRLKSPHLEKRSCHHYRNRRVRRHMNPDRAYGRSVSMCSSAKDLVESHLLNKAGYL